MYACDIAITTLKQRQTIQETAHLAAGLSEVPPGQQSSQSAGRRVAGGFTNHDPTGRELGYARVDQEAGTTTYY